MDCLGHKVNDIDHRDHSSTKREVTTAPNVDFPLALMPSSSTLALVSSSTERLRRWKPPLVQYLRVVVRTPQPARDRDRTN
jgi:hypothetical protein